MQNFFERHFDPGVLSLDQGSFIGEDAHVYNEFESHKL